MLFFYWKASFSIVTNCVLFIWLSCLMFIVFTLDLEEFALESSDIDWQLYALLQYVKGDDAVFMFDLVKIVLWLKSVSRNKSCNFYVILLF